MNADRTRDLTRRPKFSWIYLAPLFLATPAIAENRAVCDDLRGQLANISETIGVNHQIRRYSTAIIEQKAEIQQADNDLRDNECSSGSVVVINGQEDELCAQIEDQKKRLQRNLQALTIERDNMNHGSDARSELQAALRANGCEAPQADDTDTVISTDPGFQSLPEPREPLDAVITPLDQSGGPSRGSETPSADPTPSYAYGESYGGNVRTVCVRTCDGGFFPMTAGANPGDFQRDGQTCAKMCPGVKTELFFHGWPNQETSSMVSASTGAPYSAMPYAFAFRRRPPNEKSSCTCNLPAYYEEMRRENALTHPDSSSVGKQSSVITIAPKTPAAPAVTTKSVAPPELPPAPERPYDPTTSKVRQVGPQFLSSDQHSLDLKNPAAPGPQPQQ